MNAPLAICEQLQRVYDDGAGDLALKAKATIEELYGALEALEPHLDAIVCYASTMGEHEPNRLAFNARAALGKPK